MTDDEAIFGRALLAGDARQPNRRGKDYWMTIARALLTGVVIVALVFLGVVAPTILKVMIAILWGIVILIAAQLVLGGALALVLPAALFPVRPEDAHASSDEAPLPSIGERPTAPADATQLTDHALEEVVAEPARTTSIPRSVPKGAGRRTLSMVHSLTGCRKC